MNSVMASNSTKLYLDMKNISMYNFSRWLNITYYEASHNSQDGDQDQLYNIYKSYIIAGIIIFIAGAVLSLWFLVAILRSENVRSCLRNKLICNIFLIILFDCLLVAPLVLTTMWRMVHGYSDTCIHYSIITHLELIQDFMENWILVMLLAIFIAQIQYTHPSGTFSQRTITKATSALLVLPWIVSLTVVPVTLYAIAIRSGNTGHCLYLQLSDIAIFTCIDTAIPLCLSLILVIIAALLRHRRFSRGDSTDAMSTELISSGAETEIDSAYVYGIAVVVSIVCDFPDMLAFAIYNDYRHIIYNHIAWHRFMAISATMRRLRVVLLPLVWILFPDIRKQIKTWRPWRRPPLDADVTVTYMRVRD